MPFQIVHFLVLKSDVSHVGVCDVCCSGIFSCLSVSSFLTRVLFCVGFVWVFACADIPIGMTELPSESYLFRPLYSSQVLDNFLHQITLCFHITEVLETLDPQYPGIYSRNFAFLLLAMFLPSPRALSSPWVLSLG